MEAAALREQLAPFVSSEALDDALLAAVETHLELLLRWNQRMNLTAVRTMEEMVSRHFGESLFAASQLVGRDSAQSAIDVGSGAGFPGMPMKYWSPGLRLTLLESHGKKATFLRELCRALPHLGDLSVVNARAEALTLRAELVTLRAVERFERILPAAASLVAPGGRLALLIGEAQRERALALLPPGESSSCVLPQSRQRILLTWKRPA